MELINWHSAGGTNKAGRIDATLFTVQKSVLIDSTQSNYVTVTLRRFKDGLDRGVQFFDIRLTKEDLFELWGKLKDAISKIPAPDEWCEDPQHKKVYQNTWQDCPRCMSCDKKVML